MFLYAHLVGKTMRQERFNLPENIVVGSRAGIELTV